jgi:hypothetical protein
LISINRAGSTLNVVSNMIEIEIVSNIPTDAAPLCGLNDSEKKVPMVVRALITTARPVLDDITETTSRLAG